MGDAVQKGLTVPEPSGIRPIGELVVNVERPIARFGQAITFGVIGADHLVWVARATDGGTLDWYPHDRGVAPAHPTLYLDDMELAALDRALKQMPVRYKGDASMEHLADAITVRDRLLKLVEEGWVHNS